MRIEVLFPELGNLYGDHGNIQYLTACVPETEVIYTGNLQEPEFVRGTVDLIYLGSMSEEKPGAGHSRLAPYADRLKGYIEKNGVLLATGNALELFGAYIQEDRRRIPLWAFSLITVCGTWSTGTILCFSVPLGGMKIVGTRSQFFLFLWRAAPSLSPGDRRDWDEPRGENGRRSLPEFFATYLLGPFWCSIPVYHVFAGEAGIYGPLAFQREAMEAYTYRLRELERPGVRFQMGEHG